MFIQYFKVLFCCETTNYNISLPCKYKLILYLVGKNNLIHMKQKVFMALKPKVSAFGFDKSEVMGIAAEIANNLNLKEDATDEEINEAIETQVNAVVPYLKFGQSQANRVINDWKKNNANEGEVKPDPKEQKPAEENNELKELKEALFAMRESLKSLEAEKTTNVRKARLEKILDGSGTFAKSKLRDFSRMKFEKDEDFDAFCDEVESDLKSLVQESANQGLSKMTPPQNAKDENVDVMSDEEIDKMADGM